MLQQSEDGLPLVPPVRRAVGAVQQQPGGVLQKGGGGGGGAAGRGGPVWGGRSWGIVSRGEAPRPPHGWLALRSSQPVPRSATWRQRTSLPLTSSCADLYRSTPCTAASEARVSCATTCASSARLPASSAASSMHAWGARGVGGA